MMCVIMLIAVLITSLMPTSSAHAADLQPLSGVYTLTVEQGSADGISGIDTSVDLYRIADVVTEQGNGAFQYSIEKQYSGASCNGRNIENLLKGDMDDGKWSDALQAVAGKVFGIQNGNKTASQNIYPDETVRMADGKAEFKGVKPGLYMVVTRHTDDSIQDYVSVWDDGRITTMVKTSERIYRWTPSLVCIPSEKIVGGNGYLLTVKVKLKPSVENIIQEKPEEKHSILNIRKSLIKYAGKETTFRFTADVYDSKDAYDSGKKPVQSIPISIAFTKAETKTVQASVTIPENSFIVVYENQPDSPYKLTDMSYTVINRNGNTNDYKVDIQKNDKMMIYNSGYGNVITAVFTNGISGDGSTIINNPVTVPSGGQHNIWVKTGDTSVGWIVALGILVAIIGIVFIWKKNDKK